MKMLDVWNCSSNILYFKYTGTLFSVGYSEKDIQGIQDIPKTRNTTFAYLLNQTVFYGNLMVKNIFKNLSCLNCDLWYLQKRHFWK